MAWPFLILLFSVGGFALSIYIYTKKRRAQPLMCPLKGNCHAVVTSEYSKFLGVPVERIGMTYYGLIAVGYAAALAVPNLAPVAAYVLVPMTTAAALFSVYLSFIQFFSLKQICTWCLVSALLCLTIFGIALSQSINLVSPFLVVITIPLVVVHTLAAAIGVGTATVVDVLFFRFLRDFRISKFESQILNIGSQIIWGALGILLVSGLGLYLPHIMELNQDASFLVKMIVLAILILNGAALNLYLAPRLVHMTFRKGLTTPQQTLCRIRHSAFLQGGVSFVSWYSVFILGVWQENPFAFRPLMATYLVLIVLALIVGQLLERFYVRRANGS